MPLRMGVGGIFALSKGPKWKRRTTRTTHFTDVGANETEDLKSTINKLLSYSKRHLRLF